MKLRALAHDRRVLAALLALGMLLAVRELAWSAPFHGGQRLLDFRVFWCGGQAALNGASPYVFEPLRSCEHRYGAGPLSASPNLVMPFVLPPFDVALFAQLARLPYARAALVFSALSVLALAAAIGLVARSVRAPVVLAAAGLAVSVGVPSLSLGQIVPLELLFLSAAGCALVRRWDGAAGVCAGLCLLEPHVGAFVAVSVAVLVPRARIALSGSLAALAALCALADRVAPPGVYLALLARHARAEAGFYEQYSMTYALRSFGVPLDVALAAGALSSAVLLFGAVWLARGLAARDVRAAVAYVPAACAVFGGTFVHLTQIALAVPAALIVFVHARDPRARRLGALAFVLLAVPWAYPVLVKQALASALLVVAVTVWYAGGARYRTTLAAVAVLWLALVPIENRPPPAVPVPLVTAQAPAALASGAWQEAVDRMAFVSPRYFALKLPTWAGLFVLLAAMAGLRRAPQGPADAPMPASVGMRGSANVRSLSEPRARAAALCNRRLSSRRIRCTCPAENTSKLLVAWHTSTRPNPTGYRGPAT